MRDLIQRTIDILKSKVKTNLDLINENQDKIKDILKQSSTTQRSKDFEERYTVNKALLAENNDYINIQLTLINFLEKYKNTAVLEENQQIIDIYSITDEKEILELTIKGVLLFDEQHPKYNDEEFIDKMITYFESIEEYEKCQELIELKKKFA
jgi:hypothetical protein